MGGTPTDWGMYTPRGNEKLTKLAEAFTLKANKCLSPAAKARTALAAVRWFFAQACMLRQGKATEEVGDTAVREELFEFAWQTVKPLGVCRLQVEDLYWEVL